MTGGGPGLMEAANRGAREGGGFSAGFNIQLPHEQFANEYLDLGLTFKHFYARKVMFVRAAEGFVVLSGRLRDARRAVRGADPDPDRQDQALPRRAGRRRVLGGLLAWTRERQLAESMISPTDLDLVALADEPGRGRGLVRACLEGTCRHCGPEAAGTAPAVS